MHLSQKAKRGEGGHEVFRVNSRLAKTKQTTWIHEHTYIYSFSLILSLSQTHTVI